MNSLLGITIPFLLAAVPYTGAMAAEPAFVGVLALVVEEDVARELKLTDQQKQALAELIDRREAEVEDLALAVMDLPQAQREEKLAPFRRESETSGLEILTEQQRELFKQIRARRGQAEASQETAEPEVAEPPVVAVEPATIPEEDKTVEQSAATVAEQLPSTPGRLRFSFRYQPWNEVLDWFARQADLSLVADATPHGTFNYVDQREYTPAEAIDLLNGVLLTKGYTLIRRGRMLMLINLEDGIPPNLVPTVSLEELDQRGEFELITVLFDLQRLKPEEAEVELKKLAGPQGTVVALPKSRQILVTETAGRLRAMRAVIRRVDDPQGLSNDTLRTFDLKYAMADEVLGLVRQLLDIPEDKYATPDGSIRIAVDTAGDRLLVSGRPDMLARLEEILEAVDTPGPGQLERGGVDEVPQLEVYSITAADPASVLAVMQTLLAGLPDVRLASDPKTGNLVAMARPSQHKTIRATLDQMQRDARQIEVIRLSVVDPQLAVLSINKLFGGGGEEPDANAPQVDADPTTSQLLIRATRSQIEQIRTLLEKMGESETPSGAMAEQGNVRILPLTGPAARSALERIQDIWPALRRNRIRVVTPLNTIPAIRPGNPSQPQPSGETPPQPSKASSDALIPAEELATPPKGNSAGRVSHGGRVFFAADPGPPANEPAPIIVAPGPGGLMIVSEDLEALDEFEQLLTTLAGSSMAGGSEMTIFYLRHVKADLAAQTLDEIFGGGTLTTSGDGGGAGSMLGNLAGAALGDAGGGILGTLLDIAGDEGTIAPSGILRITPDMRLNALIVQANPTDLDRIEQLLKILDQKESPEEVLVVPKAKMIPVLNTQAEEIAGILKEVYRDRLVTGSQSGSGQRPSPQDFFRMLRGGGGGRPGGGNSKSRAEDVQKMTLSIDVRTNSIIVAAPEVLLNEVEQLVRQLDQAALVSNQATRVVTLRRASPQAIQQALSAMVGDSVLFGKGKAKTSSQKPSSSPPRPPGSSPSPPSSGYRPPSSYRPSGTSSPRPSSSGPPRR